MEDEDACQYYGSSLDKTSLDKGDKYNEMPGVHVIYVSENDVMKTGEAVCPVEKTLGKSKSSYDDGRHITYIVPSYAWDVGLPIAAGDFKWAGFPL